MLVSISNLTAILTILLRSSSDILPLVYLQYAVLSAHGSEKTLTPGTALAICASRVDPQRAVLVKKVRRLPFLVGSPTWSARLSADNRGMITSFFAAKNCFVNMKGAV